MKLRIKGTSWDAATVHRLDVPDGATWAELLEQVRALLPASVPAPASVVAAHGPHDPNQQAVVVLSLNKKDALACAEPGTTTVKAMGVSGGDCLWVLGGPPAAPAAAAVATTVSSAVAAAAAGSRHGWAWLRVPRAHTLPASQILPGTAAEAEVPPCRGGLNLGGRWEAFRPCPHNLACRVVARADECSVMT